MKMLGSSLVLGLATSCFAFAPSAPLALTSAVEAVSAGDQMPQICVRAFSKDICDGIMYRGQEFTTGCSFEPCRTLVVQGATLFLPMKHNPQTCSADGRCDESIRLDGELKAAVNYTIRMQDPCAYRGCIEGEGEYRHPNGGFRFQGRITGTIGAGSHREWACPEFRRNFCEKCLDVEYVGHGLWRIGFEATFHGDRVDVPTGERICFSISGDWYVEGDASGPHNLPGEFKIRGTADGSHLDVCF